MSVALVVAIVSGLIAISSVVLTAVLERRAQREEREATREEQALQLLSTYRDPLLDAAFQLQSRLWNICTRGFLEIYLVRGDERERLYARESTQWLLGQFLGWMEIVRREAQYLDLAETPQSHALSPVMEAIRGVLRTDALPDRGFRIFLADQRAIGEIMLLKREEPCGRAECMGYAEFVRRLPEPDFERWFGLMGNELHRYTDAGMRTRLIGLQHSLIDLIDLLDPTRARIPADRERVPA